MSISEPEEVVITGSPAETRALAARLAGELRPGSVLALHGDLGSGKTCFVQGLAEALGVQGAVSSPTFIIVNEHHGRLALFHVDLYRISGEAEAEDLALEEYLEANGVTAVEWAERAAALLPERTIHLFFSLQGSPESRRIVIRRPSVIA